MIQVYSNFFYPKYILWTLVLSCIISFFPAKKIKYISILLRKFPYINTYYLISHELEKYRYISLVRNIKQKNSFEVAPSNTANKWQKPDFEPLAVWLTQGSDMLFFFTCKALSTVHSK